MRKKRLKYFIKHDGLSIEVNINVNIVNRSRENICCYPFSKYLFSSDLNLASYSSRRYQNLKEKK